MFYYATKQGGREGRKEGRKEVETDIEEGRDQNLKMLESYP